MVVKPKESIERDNWIFLLYIFVHFVALPVHKKSLIQSNNCSIARLLLRMTVEAASK